MPLQPRSQSTSTQTEVDSVDAVHDELANGLSAGDTVSAPSNPTQKRPSLSSLLKPANEASSAPSSSPSATPSATPSTIPSPTTAPRVAVSQQLNWQQVSERFTQDLRVLFPDLTIDSDLLNLTGDISWQIQAGADLSCNADYLLSDAPEKLNGEQRGQVWKWLSQYLTD